MVYITFIHHSHYIYVDKIKRKTKKRKRTFWTNILISYKLFRDKQDWYLQCLQIQFSLQLRDGTYIQASLQILLSCSGIFTILVPKNRKLCDAFELSYVWYRIIIERNQIWKIVLSQTSPFSLLKKISCSALTLLSMRKIAFNCTAWIYFSYEKAIITRRFYQNILQLNRILLKRKRAFGYFSWKDVGRKRGENIS